MDKNNDFSVAPSNPRALTVTWCDEDGDEQSLAVPARFDVCPDCEGSGCTLVASIRDCAYSREDFAEDPDFEEGYFGGRYDETCRTCRGLRVVQVADPDSLAWRPAHAAALQQAEEQAMEQARCAAEEAAERRMGA